MSVSETKPPLRWETGHRVYSMAASHDGTKIVSGSKDHLVHVWDVRTGSLVLGPLKGHTGWVRAVAWSHDDEWVASGSGDATICLWSSRTGALICEPLKGHTSAVHSVSFSSDSTRIVSSSDDQTIRLWDTRTGVPIGEPLRGHYNEVRSVVFSHADTRIVCGSNNGTVFIWDACTGAPVGEPLRGHADIVRSVSVSPDNIRIVSGSVDMTIYIWDVRTGASIGPLKGHTGAVYSVAFSPDNTRIVSGSHDKTIRIWDARTGASIGEPLRGHNSRVYSAVFSPDSTRVISRSYGGSICVWETPTRKSLIDVVTSNTSAQDMFDSLVKHGCVDLSSSIDPTRYSTSVVASGGFGDVWKALTSNDELVAVKCLRLHSILEGDPKGMKRATRELHHWSKARHENIQELLGIVMFQDRLGMVSLWMENGNLQQYIKKNPNVDRYPLCEQVAKGVAYMHGIGMVHGDFKTVNILVSADGVDKITDFDYSMLSESTLRFSQTTRSGGGTIRWMAPELLLHQEDDSPPVERNTTTDVYALGMTMLEIVSGKVPYHQYQFDAGIIRAHDRKEPPRHPQELSGPDSRLTCMWSIEDDTRTSRHSMLLSW